MGTEVGIPVIIGDGSEISPKSYDGCEEISLSWTCPSS
jgi:hypothetical protein